MKTNTLLLAVTLVAGLGFLSIARLGAQPMTPMGPSGMHGQMAQCMQMMQRQMHARSKSPADMAMMQSMGTMHRGMMSMQLTGQADHDFMAMMIPHHQAAIEMAQSELKYGKNLKVRALAQKIITAQQAEIAQMQAMLK